MGVEQVDHRFHCPGCGEAVDVSAEAVGRLVRCPYCNTEFFAAEGWTHDLVVDDTEPAEEPERSPDELDVIRMRQLSAERTTTLRARSWWLIGLFLAIVAMVDLLGKAALYVSVLHTWGIRPTLFVAGALGASALGTVAWRKARTIARRAAKSSLVDPVTPPDFSTLDDGSNRWRVFDRL